MSTYIYSTFVITYCIFDQNLKIYSDEHVLKFPENIVKLFRFYQDNTLSVFFTGFPTLSVLPSCDFGSPLGSDFPYRIYVLTVFALPCTGILTTASGLYRTFVVQGIFDCVVRFLSPCFILRLVFVCLGCTVFSVFPLHDLNLLILKLCDLRML